MGRATLGVITVLYLLAVAFIVFWPSHVDAGASGQTLTRILAAGHRDGWLPAWFGYAQVEWLSNIAMFIPGGLLFTLLLRPVHLWLIPAGGLVATCAIEATQHFMPERTSSLADVLANFLGCVIGWVFALALLKTALKPKNSR
ncbi:VanZ family protein [Rothia nasisuis]|uniref:VanZ family protein n=1 Tax=Rothia nasisuis TaxID=2109647 RepID=UPI001F1D4623|nr:VanZ family protein [Rothia nasisuis]